MLYIWPGPYRYIRVICNGSILNDHKCNACRFAAAFTLYFLVMHIMAYWCSDWLTFRSIWFAAINSNNMWFSFLKAWTNVLVSKFTQKQSGFKVGDAVLVHQLAQSRLMSLVP